MLDLGPQATLVRPCSGVNVNKHQAIDVPLILFNRVNGPSILIFFKSNKHILCFILEANEGFSLQILPQMQLSYKNQLT